jgi:hypothetical protein
MERVDAAALARAARVQPPGEPGEELPTGEALAGLWLSALERLLARAAHEVNGALNGLSVNLEVVRLKARPGADAGAVARFADVAAGELGATMRLVGALVALARAPRDDGAAGTTNADVADALRQAAALVAPVVAHERVLVEIEGAGEPAPTGADRRAVRLAVVEALLAGAAAAVAGSADLDDVTVEPAGAERAARGTGDADEPTRILRCMLALPDGPSDREGPVLRLRADGRRPLRLAAAVAAALADAGVSVAPAPGTLTLRFPPPA